ncbi:MAG: hypothetical protein NE328_11890 [Lentisphaeraceae bacterium]|nr:hypothetical protein [Lentisphaeraceae bacterium]
MTLFNVITSKAFEIPGKNLKVQVSQSLVNKDLSGQTSGTDVATAGNKPKKISISLQIPKKSPNDLRSLSLVAEDIDQNGDRIEYNIVDETCKAVNIRKVRFDGSVTVREEDSLQAWQVSFSLQEIQSVAERKEQRLQKNEVSATSADGKVIATTKEIKTGEQVIKYFQENLK